MNIILVCINNFQPYILTNIEQLIKLKHNNIIILTNKEFFNNFNLFINNIILVDIQTLSDSYNFFDKTSLDKSFRNGFWTLTSLRFFYIYEYMKQTNIENVIHLENDVLIYYNCDILIDLLDKTKVYIPFDTYCRNIASIMYIPSHDIFKQILDKYNFNSNDMYNFNIIQKQTKLIQIFPIFNSENNLNNEINFISQNFYLFNFIFDAAAIGQYLGGIEPRNCNNQNTIGFINETCIIKYNNYEIFWIKENNIKKPFIKINDKTIAIFNLHIHSKTLELFI